MLRRLALLFVCFMLFATRSASAQSEARIRSLLPEIDHAEHDIQWIIELAPTHDLKKQWIDLKNNVLDALTQGMDLKKPLEIDLVFRKDELLYEFRIPVKNLEGRDGLLANIKASGFKVNEITKGSYFEFFEPKKKPYYLRYDKQYAWISMNKAAVPANPPAADQDMGELLGLKKDVVAELANKAEGMDERRSNFKELRKQFESAVKERRRNESDSHFELRKLSLIQQLNEAERFLVEAEKLLTTWITDTQAKSPYGRGELTITALPGTDLYKSVEEFAVKPSHFANVELHPNPVFTGKMNFAVDETRVKHSKDFFKAVRPVLELEIDARENETPDQKTATKKAMNIFIDMLDAGTALHVLDSFIDAHTPVPDKNVLVCGIRAADGKVADQILKILPEMKSGWKVKDTPIEEYAGVSIHELTVPAARVEQFKKFFAGESVLYVGTSKDVVWGAAGLDAIKHLKEAIDQAAKPAPEKADPVFTKYQIHVAKVSNLLDAVKVENKDLPPPKNKDAQKERERAQKAIEKYRDLAKKAMAGCDSLMHGELKRDGNTISGYLEINECVLKYIGAMMANGVKETMQ